MRRAIREMFERYLKDPEVHCLGDLLQCPVSLTLMRDPVVLIPSGITVEKGVAERLQGTCPVTRVPITGTVKNYALKAISDAFFQGKFASWDNREVVLAHIEDGVDKLRAIESLKERIKNLEMLNAREQRHRNELEDDFKSKIRILQARIKTVETLNKTVQENSYEEKHAALNQAEEFKYKIRILEATIADERQARINQEDETRMYREQAEHFEAEMQRYEPIVTPAPEESLSDGPVFQSAMAFADGPALYKNHKRKIENQYGSLEIVTGYSAGSESMRLTTPMGAAWLHNTHSAQPITENGPWLIVPTSFCSRVDVVEACRKFLHEEIRLQRQRPQWQ